MLQISKLGVAEDFDAFVAAPENADKLFEWIGGEAIEVVSNPYSSKVAATILGALFVYLKGHNLGHVTGADGGYIVAGERYVPDVAFITYQKQATLSYEAGYNPNPPDLAVEVISPRNTPREVTLKVANYLAAGTTVWVVYPQPQEVHIFVPGRVAQVARRDDHIPGGELLPDFQLAVKEIFSAE